jgi:predicted dithiol-disulfide oxidoreductase (DUF899 family)
MKEAVFRIRVKGAVKTTITRNRAREEWLAARKQLLAREKQLTRERDAIAAERRQLPWGSKSKRSTFSIPPAAKKRSPISSIGKSQLIVYNLIFGPEWKEVCPSCSFNT